MEKRTISTEDKQYPILTTKLYVPQLRSDLVLRKHLVDRLNDGINRKLTLISAPAGFGKTTLLSEWISQSKIPIAWLSLDKGDSDPVQFINYLVAALRGIEASIGKTVLSVIHSLQGSAIDSIVISLIKEASELPDDFALVLDDYHSIDAEEVHRILELLLDYLPAHIHLVIATRADPPLPLARLRVNSQLTELRTMDLCFSADETALFFEKSLQAKLSSRDISMFQTRTEGWIAGLQLAAISIKGYEDATSFIKSFAGDDRYIMDYLTEEVLNLQPGQIQKFLLETSILNRLSEPLCDFVTRTEGSQSILEKLEGANLFLIALDNKRQWYRYHHLFGDLLRKRLQQTRKDFLSELHSRACEWCKKHGFIDDAIEHALCMNDLELAIHLIEERAEAVWVRGEHNKLRRWLDSLPVELLLSKPYLCIFRAWELFKSGRQDLVEQTLQTAERVMNSSDDDTAIVQEKSERLSCLVRGRAEAIRSFICGYLGDVPGIIKHAGQALEYLPRHDLIWRNSATVSLGDAYSIKGDLPAAHLARLEAANAYKITGDTYFTLLAHIKVGMTLLEQGKLQETLQLFQEQLQFATEKGMEQTDIVGWMSAMWGEVLAEQNDMASAIRMVKKGMQLCENRSFLEIFAWNSICLIKILFYNKDLVRAEKTIQKMRRIAEESDIPFWFVQQITFWQIRIWLIQEKLEHAYQAIVESRLDFDKDFKPLQKMDFFKLNDYILLARIKIHQGHPDESIRLLQQLIGFAESGERTPRVIEILILQALAFQIKGNRIKAIAVLKKALSLGEPENYIRIFVIEGQPMAQLLEKILEAERDIPRAYVKKLLMAFKLDKLIKTENGPVENLSERELEVMRLIAAGLSNKKIMEELYVSMSTVKTHIRNIYSKLSVNSRTQATIKAKELNLL